MHEHVQKLLDLQKVDQEVSSLTKDIDQLPAEEEKRKRRLDQLERAATEAAAAMQKAEVESRNCDSASRAADEQVTKLNERLNVCRNNAEYQATLFEIESVKKDRDQIQDDGLQLLEQMEGLSEAAATTLKAFEEERAVFEGFLAEAQKMRNDRADEIGEARAKRAGAAEGIPPDLLREYEGLYKTRDFMAVSQVEDAYCQGCYNKITMNDVARLMGSSAVVRCGSCQRVLYMAPA